jgi:DNA-binding CsgD family transcriptional regulator
MSLATLTLDDLARIEQATRVLLSPLAAPDADAWRQEAMRAVGDVLGASSGTFLIPDQPKLVKTLNLDPWFEDVVQEATGPTWSGTGSSLFPVLDVFHEAIRLLKLEVWDMHSGDHALGGEGVAFNNEWYDVLRSVKAVDTHALFVPSARGSAMMTLHGLHRKAEPGEHLPVLRVLLPSFKAGLDTLGRLHAHRAALDAVAEPIVAFDADGRELHRNGALTRLLAEDPERMRIEADLLHLARGLRRLAFPLAGERGAGPAPIQREVRTARGRYTLRGALLPPGAFGPGETAMVSVAAEVAAALPSADVVRVRFGLSRREAEVALVVAEGLPNEAIAERLFVSKHTVRHHVEAVLSKLGVTGRAAVAARLLQPA